jgi:hypothetical protein
MITHVAIRDGEKTIWSLPQPNRHHHLIHAMHVKHGKQKAWQLLGEHEQGFLNDKGEFLDRQSAWYEAARCGQLSAERSRRNIDKARDLFSEDLW